jgi:hypothetical protein
MKRQPIVIAYCLTLESAQRFAIDAHAQGYVRIDIGYIDYANRYVVIGEKP